MGHHQTATHRSGKHSYHQIGLVRGQFGNVPGRRLARLDRQDRLRRLGRSHLGTRPEALRRRRRGQGLRRRTGGQGQEARPGNLFAGRPSARPGAGRRTERQDDSVPGGRVGRSLRPLARRRQQAAAHRSVFCSRGSCRNCPSASDRSFGQYRCAWRISSASCKTASCRCRASSARRPIAGAIGFCFRRCPARWADIRFPTSTRSASNCSSSVSRRCFRPA